MLGRHTHAHPRTHAHPALAWLLSPKAGVRPKGLLGQHRLEGSRVEEGWGPVGLGVNHPQSVVLSGGCVPRPVVSEEQVQTPNARMPVPALL